MQFTRHVLLLLPSSLLLFCLLCAPASAQRADNSTPDVLRLRRVEQILATDQQETRQWWRTWMLVQSGLFVSQVSWAVAVRDDEGARAEHLLNASGSLLSVLTMVVLRPPALKAATTFRDAPEGTAQTRRSKLELGERLLGDNARMQRFASGPAAYLGGLAVGLAIALPLWLKYDRQLSGAQALVGSLALTAVQAATLPRGSLEELSQAGAPRVYPQLSFARGNTLLQLVGTW